MRRDTWQALRSRVVFVNAPLERSESDSSARIGVSILRESSIDTVQIFQYRYLSKYRYFWQHYSLHPRLRVLTQLHLYCQICWWYCGPGPRFQRWRGRILGWGGETYIMVPGQLSLSEREQNHIADCRLQEETTAALHSSYDQRDPCGEGE